MKNRSNILNAFYGGVWAVMPDTLKAIDNFLESNLQSKINPKDFHLEDMINNEKSLLVGGKRHSDERLSSVRLFDNVAILPVYGALFPRASLMSLSGGTDVQTLSNQYQILLDDSSISAIILDVDSPGGTVVNTGEFSKLLFSSRGIKRTVTFYSGYGASSGFHIGSSTGESYGAPFSVLGSIGVMSILRDESKKDENEGVVTKTIISSQSPLKNTELENNEALQARQTLVNDMAEVFINDVARNRGVTADIVKATFGRGGVMIAEKALKVGMIDGVTTMHELIAELRTDNSNNNNKPPEGEFMSLTIEQLKADHKDIYTAVFNEGKTVGITEGKTLGIAEGTETAHQRIQDIEAKTAGIPGAETVLKDAKFDASISAGDVALKVLAHQQTEMKAKGLEFFKAGTELASQVQEVNNNPKPNETEIDEAKEEKAILDDMGLGEE